MHNYHKQQVLIPINGSVLTARDKNNVTKAKLHLQTVHLCSKHKFNLLTILQS